MRTFIRCTWLAIALAWFVSAVPAQAALSPAAVDSLRAILKNADPMQVFEICGPLVYGEHPECPELVRYVVFALDLVKGGADEDLERYSRAHRRDSTGEVNRILDDIDMAWANGRVDYKSDAATRALSEGRLVACKAHARWGFRYMNAKDKSGRNPQPKKAIEEYTRSIEIYPTWLAHLGRAWAYSAIKDDAAYRADVRRAAQIAADLAIAECGAYSEPGLDPELMKELRGKLDRGESQWSHTGWYNRIEKLFESGAVKEAFALSAAHIAFDDTWNAYTHRFSMLCKLKRAPEAMQTYEVMVARNAGRAQGYQPQYEAMRALQEERACPGGKRSLFELLAGLSTLSPPKGTDTILNASDGLRTQWQPDGALRYFTGDAPGVCLLPEGGRFQLLLPDGSRGPVLEPEVLRDGSIRYPRVGDMDMLWLPSGDVYYGKLSYVSWGKDGEFCHCDGTRDESVRIGGRPMPKVQTVLSRAPNGTTTYDLGRGLMSIEHPDKCTLTLIPGVGVYQGTYGRYFLPDIGVARYDDGTWELFLDGESKGRAPWRTPLDGSLSRGRMGYLNPAGEIEIHEYGVLDKTYVTFDSEGNRPVSRTVPKFTPEEIAQWNAERKQREANEDVSAGVRTLDASKRRMTVCYRCHGTGQYYEWGSTSQSGVAAPGYLSPSQAEAFRNSSQSVKITKTSGGMVKCPVCGGAGRY